MKRSRRVMGDPWEGDTLYDLGDYRIKEAVQHDYEEGETYDWYRYDGSEMVAKGTLTVTFVAEEDDG